MKQGYHAATMEATAATMTGLVLKDAILLYVNQLPVNFSSYLGRPFFASECELGVSEIVVFKLQVKRMALSLFKTYKN